MANWPLQVLVFGAGEAIDGTGSLAGPIAYQLAQVGQVATNAVVAALAQLDASAGSYRWLLDPARRFPPEPLASVNTGDPSELVSFVDWAATLCPAERTVLVLSGHGLAWNDALAAQVVGASRAQGLACPAGGHRHARRLFGRVGRGATVTRAVLLDGGHRDYLSNVELAAACEHVAQRLGRPLDVLVFDACLMSSWELLTELSGSTRAVVAAIDELSAAGLELAEPVRSASLAGGALDGAALAREFASRFTPRAPFDTCIALDLTQPGWARAADRLHAAVATLVPYATASAANRERVRAALRRASTSLVRFTAGGLADLGALATACAEAKLPSAAVAEIAAARDAIAEGVIAISVGETYRTAVGVSIFAPGTESIYAANRVEYRRLGLARSTGWDGLLDVLFGFTPS